MNKKKILHIVGGLNTGGVQTVVMNLLRYIDREKYEFHFVVFGEQKGFFEDEVNRLGGKVFHIPNFKFNYIGYITTLINLMKSSGPYSIVHSHVHLNSGAVLLAARLAGVTGRIAHAHSIKRDDENKGAVKRIYEKTMKTLIQKNTTYYLACSHDAGNYLFGKKNFKQNGSVLPNSIELEKFAFSYSDRIKVRKELNIENKLVMGNVGRLSKVKNQAFILEILEDVLRKGLDATLLLIGDGEEQESLVKFARNKGIEDKVLFLGNKNDISLFLNAMDVFLFPSLHEGLGISIIESQANGLATLISDRIPKEAIFNENVYVLNLHDKVDIWSEKLIQVNLEHINEVNPKLYEHGYDIRSLGNKIDEIYQYCNSED